MDSLSDGEEDESNWKDDPKELLPYSLPPLTPSALQVHIPYLNYQTTLQVREDEEETPSQQLVV